MFLLSFVKKTMSTKKNIVAAGPFQHYINIAEDTDVVKAIHHNTKEFKKLLKNIPQKKRNYAYAEGKWTIKELVQHTIDAERVFAYRALTFARLDATPLPGFDENNWALAANKTERKWDDLEKEFKTVRAATELLFESLGEPELLFTGTASNHPLNALALGYVIAGHTQHHINIIKERYLNKK
jgi:DinB superfamily